MCKGQVFAGNPSKEGIVWPHVCEIALVGALGMLRPSSAMLRAIWRASAIALGYRVAHHGLSRLIGSFVPSFSLFQRVRPLASLCLARDT